MGKLNSITRRTIADLKGLRAVGIRTTIDERYRDVNAAVRRTNDAKEPVRQRPTDDAKRTTNILLIRNACE